MSRVLVHVQSSMLADIITNTLETGDFSVTIVEKEENLIRIFNRVAANIVLLEVSRQISWNMEEIIVLCRKMKHLDPDCKIILIVNEEKDPEIAKKVKQAKINRQIDQFLYTSVSESYLLGVFETV